METAPSYIFTAKDNDGIDEVRYLKIGLFRSKQPRFKTMTYNLKIFFL